MIRDLIKAYDKNYGFWNVLKENYKDSKIILFPVIFIVISAIGFYIVYFNMDKTTNKAWLLFVLVVIYISAVIWGRRLQMKNIKYNHRNYKEYEEYRLNEIGKIIEEKYGIKSIKQYEILDT
ncbi:hypothetical protein CHI12_06645, partial [Terribacillus saccharophilus]